MNRRQFTQRLAALFAAPALPGKAIAATFRTPATAAPALSAGAQFWANYLMKLHKTCTPKMLGNMLNISEKSALPLHQELVSRGVITTANVVKHVAHAPQAPASVRGNVTVRSGDITVRPAIDADIEALAEIWHDGWHEAHAAYVPQDIAGRRTVESFVTRVTNGLGDTLVVGPVGAPVGLCMVKEDSISQIFIHPNGRGQGYSDALLGAGEAQLATSGVTRAVLHVIPQNTRAIAFYQRNGWSGDEVIDVALKTCGEPFVIPSRVLHKNLSSATI